MNLLDRIRVVSAADHFVPFVIRDSGGGGWRIDARECLTVHDGGAIVDVMVRRNAPRSGWRHANLRTSQLVSIEWADDEIEPAAGSAPCDEGDPHDGTDPDAR